MRKIIVSNVITLDGYFEGPNREIDWFVTDNEFFNYAVDLLHAVDTILYGRITYEQMASFWPTPQGSILPDIAAKMNSLHKIVFSKTLANAAWNNSTVVNGDLADEIIKLKQQGGGDVVIFGSGQIVAALTQFGLIDEHRMILCPVILGRGNTMFKGVENKVSLTLTHTKTFGNGTMVLYYVPVED